MTDTSIANPSDKLLQSKVTENLDADRRELRLWAFLALASLGISGVFALLLAMSRIPGAETVVAWPIGFFAKGLVIHVIFSLVVWFLGVFALLASMATYELSNGTPRLAGLGRAGLMFFGMSLPLLFFPAFENESVASLNNYVPVIIHPTYYVGLLVLALGVLLPVVRLLANFPGRFSKLPPLPLAMTMGGIIYLSALVCFAATTAMSWGGAIEAFQ